MSYSRKHFSSSTKPKPKLTFPPRLSLPQSETILRRSKRVRKAVYSDEKWGFVGPPTVTTTILDLPNELLLMIFKMLPLEQLLYTTGSVCTRWKDLTAILWTKIVLKDDIPKEVVLTWISRAVCLRQLIIIDRSDANEILKCVSKQCTELEDIALTTCSSSRLRGGLMCDLLRNCTKLSCITTMGTRFKSCKFFTILGEPRRNVSYVGGITYRELIVLLKSAKLYHQEKTRVLLTIKNMIGCCQLSLDSENIAVMLDVLEKKDKNRNIAIIWNGTTELYNNYFQVQNSFNELLL